MASDSIGAIAGYIASSVRGPRGLVAIDGRGCSGKSTLASQLAEALGVHAAVVRVDSFFIPFAEQAGHHLRWDEFTRAIAQFKQGHGLKYQPYDWSTDRLLPAEVLDPPLLVVEGLYAMHRDVVDFYDARIWVEADLATRWDRVLARDGRALIDRWRNEWVPLEHRYVVEQRPWRWADIIVAGIGLEISDLGRALGETGPPQTL